MRQICLFGFESDDLCWNVFGNAEEQLSIFLGGGFCCCRRRSLVWVLCVCVSPNVNIIQPNQIESKSSERKQTVPRISHAMFFWKPKKEKIIPRRHYRHFQPGLTWYIGCYTWQWIGKCMLVLTGAGWFGDKTPLIVWLAPHHRHQRPPSCLIAVSPNHRLQHNISPHQVSFNLTVHPYYIAQVGGRIGGDDESTFTIRTLIKFYLNCNQFRSLFLAQSIW